MTKTERKVYEDALVSISNNSGEFIGHSRFYRSVGNPLSLLRDSLILSQFSGLSGSKSEWFNNQNIAFSMESFYWGNTEGTLIRQLSRLFDNVSRVSTSMASHREHSSFRLTIYTPCIDRSDTS